MIRLLDHLTPFVNEIFKTKRIDQHGRPRSIYKRVIVYFLIAFSVVSNFLLVKKVIYYETARTNSKKIIAQLQSHDQDLQACIKLKDELWGIIQGSMNVNKSAVQSKIPKVTEAAKAAKPAASKPQAKKQVVIQDNSTEKDTDKEPQPVSIEQRRQAAELRKQSGEQLQRSKE